jgi:hypothetical protein
VKNQVQKFEHLKSFKTSDLNDPSQNYIQNDERPGYSGCSRLNTNNSSSGSISFHFFYGHKSMTSIYNEWFGIEEFSSDFFPGGIMGLEKKNKLTIGEKIFLPRMPNIFQD